MSHRRKLDNLIDEPRARQRNIVFPDTVQNGRAVEVFLWKGSPNPTRVQRIAAWLFGLWFIGLGLACSPLAALARDEGDWFGFGAMILISPFGVLVGITTFRNGFPRNSN